ncbi:MAG: hypothetical protein K8R21_12540 [Leptospira sp.]|nr:hypothetical protein [Leptospira sp.]
MAKKDFLKGAAGSYIRRTLGKDDTSITKTGSEKGEIAADKEIPETEFAPKTGSPKKKEPGRLRKEKLLPKKDSIYNVNRGMRLEDYNTPRGGEDKPRKYLLLGAAVFVIWLVWFFWPASHAIFMDTQKMTPEKVSSMDPGKDYDFKNGQDFYLYYRKGWGTPKTINLKIFKVDGEREEIHNYTRPFKKDNNKAQTYYDEGFFETPGKYEVEIRNEKDEILVVKKFTIN